MTPRAALAAFFICVGCGGGSSAPDKVVPATPREGVQFGYFSGDQFYLLEQCDHVGLWWARSWGKPWVETMAAQLQAARSCGIKNVVLHLETEEPQQLRQDFIALAPWLSGWDSITVYKWDEPDMPAGGNLSDQELTDRVTRVKQVMLDSGLIGAHVGVFYSCASGKRPGIKSFDRVGCYRYDADGCSRLESDYASLRSLKAIGALLWLIPSGADINGKEGRQEPACWTSYAFRSSDVVALIAFMWQSGADPNNNITGIRDIPLMRKLYCEAGRAFLHPKEEPRC